MEDSKLAKILNLIILSAGLSLTFYVILIRLTHSFYLSIIVSLLLLSVAITEVIYHKNKKLRKLNLEKNDLSFKNNCDNFFITSHQNLILKFFQKFFKDNLNLTAKKGFLINQEKSIIIYPFFDHEKLKKDDYIMLLKLKNQEKINNILVFCFAYEQELKTDDNIVIFDSLELFSFMKEKGVFPIKNQDNIKTEKVYFKNLNKAKLFSKSSAKLFIISAIFLYINCIFVPFKFYYIMLAGINLTFAFILLIFGRNKTQIKSYDLLNNLLKNSNKKPA